MSVNLQPFPSTNVSADEGGSVPLSYVWYYLFRTFWSRLGGSGSTLNPQTISLTGSPFQQSTDISGTAVVKGGTVSNISIVRGTSLIDTGVIAGAIPLLRGDSLSVTYSAPPTVTFLPSEFVQSAT